MSGVARFRRRTVRQIFTWPVVIAVLSAAGLLSALLGDGVWDGLSWGLLAVPILLCGVFIKRGT